MKSPRKIVAGLMAIGTSLIIAGCSVVPGQNTDDNIDRFGGRERPDLPEEARTLMQEMRSARDSGDTAKEADLRKELDSKYPNMFGSGSRRPRGGESGSGSYRRGAPESLNTDTTTRAS